MSSPFFSLYTHGFVRVAAAVPTLRVADPAFNAAQTLDLARQAAARGAVVVLFPELGLSAYTCDDLFHQDALLEATEAALAEVVAQSRQIEALLLVGLPLRRQMRLFNVAVAVYKGRILSVTPKSYLPNYREFYEKRQFAAARDAVGNTITLCGQADVAFGADVLIEAENVPHFVLHAEICEDVWTTIPPSTWAAMGGATLLANLSASNITVGKADYRRQLCAAQSARCAAAYLYTAAGPGESTTDLAWDGQALIFENGEKLAESERFAGASHFVCADIDLERLVQERTRLTSFTDTIHDEKTRLAALRRVSFHLDLPAGDWPLARTVEQFPFVPADAVMRDERCYEAYNIQVHGLLKRLQATGIQKIVIGVSGGLDSTHALIVAARTMDKLGLPRANILGFTMPGFATGEDTRRNAHALMTALDVTAREIDIKPSSLQMLRDLSHPFAADGSPVYDITFENVQAGERTSHLFRLANFHNALVLGTGDLSEMALGWCTYGVGDHMSHYNVNGSVPKTLIQYLIRWVAQKNEFGDATSAILTAIASTEISPELIPGTADAPLQSTEAKIGPYALQDFHLYYTTRFGFRPSKVAFLAHTAFAATYDLATIKKWLGVFLFRFFAISQFKRSCVPNGPKVGSGGSLSPRGDWRAPSDSVATVWLDELKNNVPE